MKNLRVACLTLFLATAASANDQARVTGRASVDCSFQSSLSHRDFRNGEYFVHEVLSWGPLSFRGQKIIVDNGIRCSTLNPATFGSQKENCKQEVEPSETFGDIGIIGCSDYTFKWIED